jgi:hypothetical protein
VHGGKIKESREQKAESRNCEKAGGRGQELHTGRDLLA